MNLVSGVVNTKVVQIGFETINSLGGVPHVSVYSYPYYLKNIVVSSTDSGLFSSVSSSIFINWNISASIADANNVVASYFGGVEDYTLGIPSVIFSSEAILSTKVLFSEKINSIVQYPIISVNTHKNDENYSLELSGNHLPHSISGYISVLYDWIVNLPQDIVIDSTINIHLMKIRDEPYNIAVRRWMAVGDDINLKEKHKSITYRSYIDDCNHAYDGILDEDDYGYFSTKPNGLKQYSYPLTYEEAVSEVIRVNNSVAVQYSENIMNSIHASNLIYFDLLINNVDNLVKVYNELRDDYVHFNESCELSKVLEEIKGGVSCKNRVTKYTN